MAKGTFINPPVPEELKVLVEEATTALRMHTGEGKAIVLTEYRKRLDAAEAGLRDKGFDKAIPDEKIMQFMANTFGKELAERVAGEWAKATTEDKELDGLPDTLKGFGNEAAVKNMAQVVGEDAARTVFTAIANKMFYEGFAFACAVFNQFKEDILIENEKPPPQNNVTVKVEKPDQHHISTHKDE